MNNKDKTMEIGIARFGFLTSSPVVAMMSKLDTIDRLDFSNCNTSDIKLRLPDKSIETTRSPRHHATVINQVAFTMFVLKTRSRSLPKSERKEAAITTATST